ncbi:hypothetical protein NW768_001313 [Fusarium equiseti]|uniref:Peroxin domain-containing protein n=1 Tax=Fusarium equiseti TaxID=61235 RepID=A0ABQ8RPV9_FUSEQ|nr:hypothetical protein NW768_001313 [Fusarium equiseti]
MPKDRSHVDRKLVIITHWEPTGDHLSAKRQHEPHTQVHIAALVYGHGEHGLISNKLAQRLLGTNEKQTTEFPPVVSISWTFDGPDQNLETSQVHIVPELEQDLVLGDNTNDLYESVHLSPPEAPLPYQLNTRGDFEKHGILPVNKTSEDKFRHLINLHRPKAQSRISDSEDMTTELVEIERLSLGSPVCSYSDSIGGSGGACYNAAAHLRRTHIETASWGWETVSIASQASSSVSNWSLVGEDFGETWNQEVTQRYRPNDFQAHPGHRFWVWDRQRQLWRRRGRSGLDERDWFIEPSSQ